MFLSQLSDDLEGSYGAAEEVGTALVSAQMMLLALSWQQRISVRAHGHSEALMPGGVMCTAAKLWNDICEH